MNIIAVVVTYNRMELLKRNIRCLQQNKPISSIVIVNNGSTDGTTEWLAAQEGLTIINQTNVGGAGGFYTGIQYAYQAGADWIWCMDDDVFPRADCLEQLLPYTGKKDIGILAPRRLLEGEIFTHDFQAYNLSNPFVSMYSKKLAGRHITSPTEITGTAFEGPFIRREVVEKIGLPNKGLFIFCDDTDYCLRTIVWQDPNHFTVTGIDKQKVGQYAAEIRAKKPPEPYKGKGIRYAGEVVKHKEGKAGKGKK